MIPTKERNNSGIFISCGTEGILVDCGENIQRQLMIKGISLSKVTKILITHWHGDHVLGIFGLIQSLGSYKHGAKLEIYGPKGTKERIKVGLKIFPSQAQKDIILSVHDILKGKENIIETPDFIINALPLTHTIPIFGYTLIERDKRRIKILQIKKLGIPDGPLLGKLQKGEDITWKNKIVKSDKLTSLIKGKKLAFVLDTGLTQNCYNLAKDADLLICESTLDSSLAEKAEARFHLTSKQAALIAKNSNVKKLILTHFSPRYKDVKILEKEAKTIFKNTIAAKDFMTIEI